MSKRNVVAAVAMLGAGGLFAGCGFSQPTAGCIVQDGEWMAKYTLKTPEHAGRMCGSLAGEDIGVYKFSEFNKRGTTILTLRPRGAAALTTYRYEVVKLDASGNPEYDPKGEVVLEKVAVSRMGTKADGSSYVPADATAIGPLADEPDEDFFCGTSSFSKEAAMGSVEVRHLRTDALLAEPDEVTYSFKQVKVYAHPSAPGTQLSGSFSYTRGGCTAEYEMVAMWPAVPCDPDSDEPADNCGEGSGINPDFDVVCDAALRACVPARPIPSLEGGR
jgi:hypothetical protein